MQNLTAFFDTTSNQKHRFSAVYCQTLPSYLGKIETAIAPV
ncbi:hypothetical protein [Nostoc sp.]